MKKAYRIILVVISAILVVWSALTIWAEMPGPARQTQFGNPSASLSALVVYDPDPIYNLDEQLCNAFAVSLSEHDIYTTVATVKAAGQLTNTDNDLYLFCANTYNWRPDRAIGNYIKEHPSLKSKTVVALTLGSGSTQQAKDVFDKIIKGTGANLIDSRTLWLLRPNDETRMEEPNVDVAVSMTKEWEHEIAKRINTVSSL